MLGVSLPAKQTLDLSPNGECVCKACAAVITSFFERRKSQGAEPGLTNGRQQLRDGSEPETVKLRWVGCLSPQKEHDTTRKLTWNVHITTLKRKINFQIIIFGSCLVGELVSPQWKHDNHMNVSQWEFPWTKNSLWFLDVPVCFPWWIAVVSYCSRYRHWLFQDLRNTKHQTCPIPSLEHSAGDQNFHEFSGLLLWSCTLKTILLNTSMVSDDSCFLNFSSCMKDVKSTFVSCLFHVFTKHVGPHLTGRAMDLLPVNSRVFSSSWSPKINGIRQASLNCQFFWKVKHSKQSYGNFE